MSFQDGMVWIVGMCFLVLTIVLFKSKVEILVNFVLRAVLGVVGLYFLNLFLANQGLGIMVGINPMTVSAVGIFGAPGLALLYGISFYNTL